MRIKTAIELGLSIREQRRKLGLDQRTLAEQVGVSRQWLVEVEKGKPRAEIALVLRTLTALELQLDLSTTEETKLTESRRRAHTTTKAPSIDLDALIENARKGRRKS